MNTMSKLPKIKYEDLPDEIKEAVEECDIEWESIVDQDYFVGFPIGPDEAKDMKVKSAKRMVAYRLWGEEMNTLYKKLQKGTLSQQEAEAKMQEATCRRDRIVDNQLRLCYYKYFLT